MSTGDRHATVAIYNSLEEAEQAGAELLAHGIQPRVVGTSLIVETSDIGRVTEILDLPTEKPPEARARFHPCPACGADDPLWFGKWKLILLLALFGALIPFGYSHLAPLVALVALIGFLVVAWRIPEFECRQCHRRWSRERR